MLLDRISLRGIAAAFILVALLINPACAGPGVPAASLPHAVEDWNATFHADTSAFPAFGYHAQEIPGGFIAIGSINTVRQKYQDACTGGRTYVVQTDSSGGKVRDVVITDMSPFTETAGRDVEIAGVDDPVYANGYIIAGYSANKTPAPSLHEHSYLSIMRLRPELTEYPAAVAHEVNSLCFEWPSSLATAIERTSDHTYFITGYMTGANNVPRLYLAKVPDGGIVPSDYNLYDAVPLYLDTDRIMGSSPSWGQQVYRQSVRSTGDGGAVVTGTALESQVTGDLQLQAVPFLAKFSPDLQLEQGWPKFYHFNSLPVCGSAACYLNDAYDVVVTPDGYAIAGAVRGLNGDNGRSGVLLILTDRDGNNPRYKILGDKGSYGYDMGSSLIQTGDGGFLIAGTRFHTYPTIGAGSDVLLIRTDRDGNELYEKTWTHEGKDNYGLSIEKTSDGGYIIAGTGSDDPAFAYELWLIRFHETEPVTPPMPGFLDGIFAWLAHLMPPAVPPEHPLPHVPKPTTPETISTTPPTERVSTGVKCTCSQVKGPVPLTVSCDATGTTGTDGNPPAAILWSFGDNTHQTGVTITHTYTIPNIYTITAGFKEITGNQVSRTCAAVHAWDSTKDSSDPWACTITAMPEYSKTPVIWGDKVTIRGIEDNCPQGLRFHLQRKPIPETQNGPGGTLIGTVGPSSTYAFVFDTGPVHLQQNLPDGDYVVFIMNAAGIEYTKVAFHISSADTTVPTTVTPTTVTPTPTLPNKAPVAVIAASTSSGSAPLTVSFDASKSNDSDGKIVSYNWAFAKAALASGKTVSHTFTAAGTYTVTLMVKDDDGATGTAIKNITVSAPTVMSHQ